MSTLTPIPLTLLTGLPGAGKTTRLNLEETLNKPSHRRTPGVFSAGRKPVSSALTFLDSGFRRNDVLRLDQRPIKRLLHQPALSGNKVEKACARYCVLEAMEARG